MSQTSFSLYLYNQQTDFYKLSCAVKPQMRAICTYMGYTNITTNNQDIRPSITVNLLLLIFYERLDRLAQSNLHWKVLIKLFPTIYGILYSNKYL